MARELADALHAPLVTSTVSRLLIDLNRSIGHPQLFSVVTRVVPATLREGIVARHYLPYRGQVEQLVRRVGVARPARDSRFVPQLHAGTLRQGAPRRRRPALSPRPARGSALCARWKASLADMAPELRVRRNYPYAGKGDGLTSYLRRCFPPAAYVGIELEVNQKIVFAGGRRWTALRRVLVDSLRAALST